MIRRSIEDSVAGARRNVLLMKYACFEFIDIVDQSAYSSALRGLFVMIESYRRGVDAFSISLCFLRCL